MRYKAECGGKSRCGNEILGNFQEKIEIDHPAKQHALKSLFLIIFYHLAKGFSLPPAFTIASVFTQILTQGKCTFGIKWVFLVFRVTDLCSLMCPMYTRYVSNLNNSTCNLPDQHEIFIITLMNVLKINQHTKLFPSKKSTLTGEEFSTTRFHYMTSTRRVHLRGATRCSSE